MAGGTGGHIFPALAVARALHAKNVEVHWLGTEQGLEKKLVPCEFIFHSLSIKAMRGKGWRRYSIWLGQLMIACCQAYRVVRHVRPDIILGTGGYVAVPGGLVAWIMRIPLIIHEQNAIAGWTNRCLSKMAKSTLQAFPQAFSCDDSQIKTIGNPIRQELNDVPVPAVRFLNRRGALRLLVLGGSQGARAINQWLLSALAHGAPLDHIIIRHQTGELDFESVNNRYKSLSVQVTVSPFIEDMAAAYSWADFAICRAGALTISELAAVGLGSLLIPYPYAVDNHQWHNSLFLVRAKAAICVPQAELTTEYFPQLVKGFLENRSSLLGMAEAARALAQPKAAEQILTECDRWWGKYASNHV